MTVFHGSLAAAATRGGAARNDRPLWRNGQKEIVRSSISRTVMTGQIHIDVEHGRAVIKVEQIQDGPFFQIASDQERGTAEINPDDDRVVVGLVEVSSGPAGISGMSPLEQHDLWITSCARQRVDIAISQSRLLRQRGDVALTDCPNFTCAMAGRHLGSQPLRIVRSSQCQIAVVEEPLDGEVLSHGFQRTRVVGVVVGDYHLLQRIIQIGPAGEEPG